MEPSRSTGRGRSGETPSGALSFPDVQGSENEFIAGRRHAAGFRDEHLAPADIGDHASGDKDPPLLAQGVNDGDSYPTVGLALTGGGIRSACVSLGFIQGLRKYGLFRYVDYLSAISGGSYTGALVASSFYRANGDRTKRDDIGDKRLDVDLVNDRVQPARVRALMNDGRYLMRPLEWANRFFSGWFSLLLVVGSALLAASALIAFVWRSMDFYIIRDYLEELGMPGDMWAALLPLAVLFALWVICWAASYLKDGASARGVWAKRVLVLLVLCAIATAAALIGNGDVALSDGVQKTASFMKFPLIVAILGGLIPVFFRERLFRSGRVESTFIEKLIYRYTAIAVVLGIPMLLIGYFAREDVSGFNSYRDGRLLLADVKDIDAFAGWLKALAKGGDAPKTAGQEGGGVEQLAATNPPAGSPSELPPTTPAVMLADVEFSKLVRATQLLRLAHDELHQRIIGGGKWRMPPRQPATILEISEDSPDDEGNVKTVDGSMPLETKTESLISESPSGGKLDAAQATPYVPAASDSTTWGDWVKWRYTRLASRSGVLFGHWFGNDADDPLKLAIKSVSDLRDQHTKLITVFNERCLTHPNFGRYLLEVDSAGRNAVASLPSQPSDLRLGSDALSIDQASTAPSAANDLKAQIDRMQRVGTEGFSPDALLEFNRGMLEIAHPELIRRRDDIQRRAVIHADQMHRLLMFLLFGGVFVLSAFIINPNTTSIQRYYQERLASAYLGGSDEAHNMRLTDLAPRMGTGPLLLIGGAANYRFRPADKDRDPDPLGFNRPIESTDRVGHFEFSPLHCGSKNLGYVRTDVYCAGSLRLADAVAISGAALNPLYFDRWEMLVIFGLLNLRLGQWLPNPGQRAISRQPTFAALMQDVVDLRQRRVTFATQRRHVLLTDGGHYDNTGLQALLERRTKVVIVCDASQDAEYRFDDLAALIGRMKGQAGITLCEIGTPYELDLGARSAAIKNKGPHFFCAEIRYPCEPSGVEVGLLVYFKSSLSGDEPPFVWNHAAKCESFPHDSTINQSFGPDQFCAYLGLGQHFVESTVHGQRHAVDDVGKSREFDIRAFAQLFLIHIDDTCRRQFLDRLLPGTADISDRSPRPDFEKAADRFKEKIRAKDWQQMPVAVAELRRCAAAENGAPRPARAVLLDLLANGIMALDDSPQPGAEQALNEAASLFWKTLVVECESDDKVKAYRDMAFEIRSRFQQPSAFRSVRPIIRQAGEWCTDDLIEHLVRDGDVALDGFIAEVMSELGELAVHGKIKKTARLRKLLATKKFSSSKDVRDCAERLLHILAEPSGGGPDERKPST